MEIMEFCGKVKKNLALYAGEGVNVSIKETVKNNGVVLHGIMVTEKGRNVSPNIYMDGLYETYEKGGAFGRVMEEVYHIYEESRLEGNMDIGFFLDYGIMKDRVVYKLISYENNRELLGQVPHIRFLDMAVTFYCHVPKAGMESATILVYNSHLNVWNITEERLLKDAGKNTPRILPPRLLSIEEMMQEIFVRDTCGKKDDRSGDGGLFSAAGDGNGLKSKMYVLGNREKLFGAAVLLYEGVLERIADTFGCGFYVLPSSIHEVILVPEGKGEDAFGLWKMVCEINATQVEPEDVLTNSVYHFSGKNRKLEKIF